MYLHLSFYFLKELVNPSLLFLSSSRLHGDPNAFFRSSCQCVKSEACPQHSQSVLWQATYPGELQL